jgi:hypothetical protein
MKAKLAFAGAALLALAACGGSGEQADKGSEVEAEAPAGITNARVAPPSDFNVADACTILSRDTVGSALGSQVTETAVDSATAATDATAGFSNCTYTLADGRAPQFFARWDPTGSSNGEETIKGIAEFAPQPPVEVPGLKNRAWWVGGLNQLHIFPDRQRYVFFTFMSEEPDKAKADAIALARQAGY